MALDDRPVFGFKMFNEHIWRVARMQLVLTADDWKKVALIRDPLEVYASWLRARKTRQWVKFKGADTGHKSEPTVQFTKDTFLKFKKFYLPFIGRALQNRDQPNWMIVRYDDLDDVAILQSVLDFVGSAARASELTSHYEKQFTRPVSDAFENWESLVEHLKRDDEMQGIDWSGTLKLTEWIRTSGAALARSMG